MNQLYSPLAFDSIRLLDFRNDSGLSCDIATFRLHDAPPFVALSYTWGKAAYQKGRPPDQKYSILLNNQKVAVQQNLHDAFTTLANNVRTWRGKHHLFWVDFICINQSDLQERSRQVRLMKDIYKRSAVVFAWLGLPYDEDETVLAVMLMRSFSKYLHSELKVHNDDIEAVMAGISPRTLGFPSVKDSNDWKAWMGIAEMMQSSYWSRTWIYQEATTPGEIRFYCGREWFDDIHLSATAFFGSEFFVKCPGFDTHFSNAVSSESNMFRLSIARTKRGKNQERRLIDLIVGTRNTTCTDARDKVYASFGHVTDIEPRHVAMEYTKDVNAVFGDLAHFLLVDGPHANLQILDHVYTPAADTSNKYLKEVFDPSWPSWIPDWRQRVQLNPLCPNVENQLPSFNPCPGSNAKVKISHTVMAVEGFTLDDLRIDHLTQICESSKNIIELARDWQAQMSINDLPRKNDESIRRTLVADIGGVKYDAEERKYYTRRCIVDLNTIRAGDSMSGRLSNVCLGRRMGRTDGGWVGVFPAAAQNGDVVSVFNGGHVLYLLRPILGPGDHFRFIGTCYVDGLMDGEASQHRHVVRMLYLV